MLGLYTVVWGKSKDVPPASSAPSEKSGAHELPITRSTKVDDNGSIDGANGVVLKLSPEKL